MHIIFDANIYAADYKLSGVAFKTLFDYIRRTESRLVLPRIIREEVVIGFGRRLKREWKDFAEAQRKYQLVDIDNRANLKKPDIRASMIKLRRKLMKPNDEVRPVYIENTTGVDINEVFMRGVHRVRPANDEGEELRDVVIWLWVLAYTSSVEETIAFVSSDGAFWKNDAPHPNISDDITQHGQNRLSIYKTIDDFLKKHAPEPTVITSEWFAQHFKMTDFERDVVVALTRELNNTLPGTVRDMTVDQLRFNSGSLYDVAADVQFTELNLSLSIGLTAILRSAGQYAMFGGGLGPFSVPLVGPTTVLGGGLGSFSVPLVGPIQPRIGLVGVGGGGSYAAQYAAQTAPSERHAHAEADAKFSARIKAGVLAEVSLDELKLDQLGLYRQLYSPDESGK